MDDVFGMLLILRYYCRHCVNMKKSLPLLDSSKVSI